MFKKAKLTLLQVRIIYILTTIFLVVLSVYGYLQTNQLLDSYKWVNHTNEVVLSLKKISSTFNVATSNRRGFLLTGDSTMLKMRDADYNLINNELNLLKKLVKDNPEQIQNLKILRTTIKERLEDLKFEKLKPLQLDTELKLHLVDGFNKTQKINELTNRMSLAEEKLLKQRTQQFSLLAYFTPLFIIILFLGALLILWISYSKINCELHHSQQLQTKVEESIKELEKINEELLKGGEQFLRIFDNNPVAMTFGEIDSNRVIYANSLFYQSFQLSKEEVIGKTTEEMNLVSAEENARLLSIIMAYLNEDRSVEELRALSGDERAKLLMILKEKMFEKGFEVLYTRRNGETFYALVFFEIIVIGNKQYALTSYQDITERKEAQNQLAEEKAFAEMIIENDPSMIVVYDENLHIITWNKKSEEFSGLKKEEVLGKSTFDVFPEYNQETWLNKFNSVLKDGKSLHFPIVKIKQKNNYTESWLLPLRNTNLKIIGVLGITRDITEIVEANKELVKKNAELIEVSEHHLKIFDNNPVAMAFAEIGSNKIMFANKLFYKQFGYTEEEVIGRTSEDLNIVSPEEKERTQAILLKELQEERTIDELQALSAEELFELLVKLRETLFKNGFEVLYTRKNKTTFFAIVFYEIIEIGNKKYALASYQDITELKKTHQQLEEQKAFAESVIENDPAMIMAYDKNLKIIAWNKKTEELTGYKKEQVIGKNPYDLFPEYNNEQWSNTFNAVLKEGKKIHYPKLAFKRIKGFGEFFILPLINAEQEITGILSITRDITEATEMTQAIEQKNIELERINKELLQTSATLDTSEERYHRMITEVKDYAIVFLSKEGIIEHWNEGAERIKGYKAEEIIGKNFNIFYSEMDRKSKLPEKLLQEAKQNGTALNERWSIRKNGSEFWGSTVITALHDSKNNIIGYSKVTRDLTEKKLAEDKILESNKALEQKNIELAKINKELESLSYISSHDLQEPLRQIQIFASRISDVDQQNLSDIGKTYFDKIQNAAKRMQNLISDLLSYSRNKTEAREFKTINLNKIMNEVIEEFSEIISDKHATFEVADLGDASIIPFQFRQMIYNIISNSLKFSNPDIPPHIIIKNKKVKSNQVPGADPSIEAEYYHISITDNGIGFEQQYKDRIFEMFQRLHDKQKIAGTGIGLAIVKIIVENHNGIITATSELNKGATFDIYIPTIQKL